VSSIDALTKGGAWPPASLVYYIVVAEATIMCKVKHLGIHR
jgi:hypothetical protein